MDTKEAIRILKEEIGITIIGRQAQEAIDLAIECLEKCENEQQFTSLN